MLVCWDYVRTLTLTCLSLLLQRRRYRHDRSGRFDVLLQLGQSTLYALSDQELTSRNAVVVLLFLCKLNSTCLWLQVPECRFCLDNLLPLLLQRRRHRGVHPLPVGRRSEFHSDGQSFHRLPSRPCAFLFGLVVSTLNLNSKSYFACVAS